jgi:hypothetical protein
MPREPESLHFVFLAAALWLVATVGALLWLPIWPRTIAGWLVVLATGPLVMGLLAAAGEVMGDFVFPWLDRVVGHRVLRMIAKVAMVCAAIGLAWWLGVKVRGLVPDGFKAWWGRNLA